MSKESRRAKYWSEQREKFDYVVEVTVAVVIPARDEEQARMWATTYVGSSLKLNGVRYLENIRVGSSERKRR